MSLSEGLDKLQDLREYAPEAMLLSNVSDDTKKY